MFRSEDLQLLAAMNLYSIKTLLTYFIIQLIFLQQYFPIPVPCNITRYCTGVIAWAGPGATRYPSNYNVL